MATDTSENEMPTAKAVPLGNPVKVSSLLDDTRALWGEVRSLSHDRFRLAALETQQAGVSLVNMVMAGVLVAGLLCSAWLGLLAAAVFGMIENGITLRVAIVFVVVLNLLLALVFCRVIRHKSRHLKFPATLHSLQPVVPGQQKTEKT